MTCIMACLDGSQLTPSVCEYSSWASKQLNAPITLLHVLDRSHYPQSHNLSGNIGLGSSEQLLEDLVTLDEQRYKIALEQGHLMLQTMQQQLTAATDLAVEIRQRHGDLIETLLELQTSYQLVIIGRQGQTSQTTDNHIGSQLETTIRMLHSPILITPSHFQTPQSAMLAYDASVHSETCLTYLLTNPLFKGLSIHLVTVGEEASSQLASAKERLVKQGVVTHTAILTGQVDVALNQYQQEQQIDLLVMGAYGHSRIRQFFVGSTTNNMLRTAQVPLLIVK